MMTASLCSRAVYLRGFASKEGSHLLGEDNMALAINAMEPARASDICLYVFRGPELETHKAKRLSRSSGEATVLWMMPLLAWPESVRLLRTSLRYLVCVCVSKRALGRRAP